VLGKQATGGWFGLAQARYARRHEEHGARHAERTIRALMTLLRRHPFDRLLLAGPDEALATLRDHLPRPLRLGLAGTIRLELFAGDTEVLAAAREAAEALERREEVALVDDLIDGATGPRVALDFAQTLAALSEGRVHRLVLADSFAGVGGECAGCWRLVAGVGPCPTCGAATRPVADLAEAALAVAHAQGARIELVSGEAAARLMQVNGLGAWTRS
jgi:peptide subunit release factor 1 (eRF1)